MAWREPRTVETVAPERAQHNWWEVGLVLSALVVGLIVVLATQSTTEMRAVSAVFGALAIVAQLKEVLYEQYKRDSEDAGRPEPARRFSDLSFETKQRARLWALVGVVIAAGSFVDEPDRPWIILMTCGAILSTVLLTAAWAKRRYGPPSRFSPLLTVVAGLLYAVLAIVGLLLTVV